MELPDVNLPVLPEQAAVYYMPPFETNIGVEDEARNKERSLGYNPAGRLIIEGVPNVYVFQKNNIPSTLTINIITGIFSINYNIGTDPSILVGNPPETETASKQVAGILSRASSLKDDLKNGIYTHQYLKQTGGIFKPVSSLSEADSIKVNLFRQNYGLENNMTSVTPHMPEANIWFVIAAGRGNEIIAGEFNYYPVDAGKKLGTYALRSGYYDAYYIVAPAEASSNLARYDGIRYGKAAHGAKDLLDLYMKTRGEGFGPEVKRRIMLGTYALRSGYYDAYYKKAQQVRALIKRDFEKAFHHVDVILTPTTPTAAFRFGAKASPMDMYLADVFTLSCNLAGLPGLSVPCGLSAEGLPIGAQLLGKPLDEATLLRAGHVIEAACGLGDRRPGGVA